MHSACKACRYCPQAERAAHAALQPLGLLHATGAYTSVILSNGTTSRLQRQQQQPAAVLFGHRSRVTPHSWPRPASAVGLHHLPAHAKVSRGARTSRNVCKRTDLAVTGHSLLARSVHRTRSIARVGPDTTMQGQGQHQSQEQEPIPVSVTAATQETHTTSSAANMQAQAVASAHSSPRKAAGQKAIKVEQADSQQQATQQGQHQQQELQQLRWRSLGTPRSELSLDFTLPTGQSFRWRRTGSGEYTGVVGQRVVSGGRRWGGGTLGQAHGG